MKQNRREFLASAAAVSLGAAAGGSLDAQAQEAKKKPEDFRLALTGEKVESTAESLNITTNTFAEAEKLFGLKFNDEQRQALVNTAATNVERIQNRRAIKLENGLAPSVIFDPRISGSPTPPAGNKLKLSPSKPGQLPSSEIDIAFAPVTSLSEWIRTKQITSTALTKLYLRRLKKYAPGLEAVITITESLALKQAAQADAEIAKGSYRDPLHGIPWGAKDLLATKDIRTTWGAGPYKNDIGKVDATVVKKLADAGAVMVAKTTLGALAMGDEWFDGKTRNPWNPEEGSSGSSAGSAACTAAGLVGFAIGTETLGSIASPSMRCGTSGLRPSFGRVSRSGAMALCWSLDKIGPICRSVEDTAIVLHAINGFDATDAGSIDLPFGFNGSADVKGARLGYDPAWFEKASEHDRDALEKTKAAGFKLVEIKLPELPYGTLITILQSEAASAFEELLLDGRDALMKIQTPQGHPAKWREARFVSAIDLIQAERFRRRVMTVMQEGFVGVDAIIGPMRGGQMLLITNFTGQPQLTLRAGMMESPTRVRPAKPASDDDKKYRVPYGINLWGPLFSDAKLCNIGMALEKAFDVQHERPKGFLT